MPGLKGRWLSFASLVLGAVLVPLASQNASAAPVALSGSIQPVSKTPVAGKPRRAYISRPNLTADERKAMVTFEVVLKMRNFDQLQSRVSRRERVSPQEMAATYEPSADNYQAVVQWLTGQGFTISRRDSHHTVIFVHGSVNRIEQALGTTFARVQADGKEYTSAITAPQVPANIAPLLVGINGLQPQIRVHKNSIISQVKPNASGGISGYLPSQIAQAYQVAALYRDGLTGTGQTIAIIIDTFPAAGDLTAFWKAAGVNQSLANIQYVTIYQDGSIPPSDETSLDVEWSSSMAPSAKIRVYGVGPFDSVNATQNFDLAYEQVYDDVINHPEYGINQMSMSYGAGEIDNYTLSQAQTDDIWFTKLASAGVSIFASSGDGGSTPGDTAGDETGSLQVEYPASDPNVTGVGGTSLVLTGSNTITSEVAWNNSYGAGGGGISTYFTAPSWQASSSHNSQRTVPDIAATADPANGGAFYWNGTAGVVGGTSWSSPVCAGICALINQGRADTGQASLGPLNPLIYSLSGTANFRDIISGSNATHTAKDINNVYSAGTGYDECTGIGVPVASTLAQTLVGLSNPLFGIRQDPPMERVIPGQSGTFTVTGGGSPTAYQWQRMAAGATTWSNLGDDANYGGSGSSTLTVSLPTLAMSGDRFQCLVTYPSGTLVGSASTLSVEVPYVVTTLAGKAGLSGFKNGNGLAATFSYPSGVVLDSSGNIYVADYNNNSIRKITPAGTVTTPYGSTTGVAGNVDSTGTLARFNGPNALAIDSSGNIYVADANNSEIRKITISSGLVSTITGATFFYPQGIAIDSSNNIYVADTGNEVIRKISSSGTISILAGILDAFGYQDGDGAAALFNNPIGVATDGAGNVYVADDFNNVIRKITPSGTVTTIAGQPKIGGYLDGVMGQALFNTPLSVAVDGIGNIYVTDSQIPGYAENGILVATNATGNDVIRKITPAGVVSTLAGTPGGAGSQDGTGNAAIFDNLQSVVLSSSGTLYLADTFNNTVRSAHAETIISVSATQPNAVTFGPVAGQFTVFRSGSTTDSLTVPYTVGGSAVANTDYTALPGSVTLLAGATAATITVNPLYNNQSADSKTVILSLTSSGSYVLTSPNSSTVTITGPTAYQSWKLKEFGSNAYVSSIGGDTADPNYNGVPNFLEYAFGANPLQTGADPSPQLSTVQDSNGNEYLALTYTQINDPNLTYTVQVTSDLMQQTDQWHSGASYTTVVSQVTGTGTTTQVTVRDNVPISQAAKRFIRVQVNGQ